MYRELNSVNQNSVDIRDYPAIHCDGYGLCGRAAVHTDRYLLSLATKEFSSNDGIEE
jgi:hypothetical protein